MTPPPTITSRELCAFWTPVLNMQDWICMKTKDEMLTVGDLNLNMMQGYANSIKEVLKQKMLSQEVIFRNQVHELHRLYRIQKSLMDDVECKELDGWNLSSGSKYSTIGPFTSPIQFSLIPKGKIFPSIPMVGSTVSVNKDFYPEYNDYFPLQRMSFNLHLPAAQPVDHVDNGHLEKSNGWNSKESIQLRDQFHDGNVYSSEEVKLTLGIGDGHRKGSGKRTWYDKAAYSSSHHVTDLEEPTDLATNEDAKSVSTLSCSTLIMGDKLDAREPFQSIHVSKSIVEKELSHGPTFRDTLIVGSYSCEEQNSKNQGIKERYNDIESNFLFTEEKPFTSCEAIGLDLNRVQLDDSFYLSDPVVASLSKASLSGPSNELMGKIYEGTCPTAASWKKTNGDCFNEVSTLMDPLIDNSSSKTWASCTMFKGQNQNGASPTDRETESVHLSCISEDLNSDHTEPGNNFPAESLKGNYADVDVIDECADRDGNIVEDVNSNKSTISCKFDCNDDDSSSGTKTTQSGTDLGRSIISPCTQLQKSDLYKVAETQSSQQKSISFDSCALKYQCCNKKEEQSSGGDALIQRAAELLIHFSLGSSTNHQDCCTKAASSGIKKEWRDQPQYSIDSYESMVLKLKESVVDDDCVSSKPVEVNEPHKKGIGVQMRRGRRLKDFQRDILPGLASLSAQEIQEDMNIMVAVIRSREYKRMRSSKTAENCFAPVKSRRSRLNYVGRRY